MRKIICDACGKEISSLESIVHLDLEFGSSAKVQYCRGIATDVCGGELCSDCGVKISDLIRDIKKRDAS